MKDRKDKSRIPILAAGGIVLRHGPVPRFAVVQLRKMNMWGLPKGKLADGEDAITAARREVLEETGHRVIIHEFLGTLAYEVNSRPKVVQFWRMEAVGGPVGSLMRDVRAVRWLALADAIDQLTHLREQVFLEQVGSAAVRSLEKSARRATLKGSRGAGRNVVQGVPLAPVADVSAALSVASHAGEGEMAELGAQPPEDLAAPPLPAADILVPAADSEHAVRVEDADNAGKTLIKKTWGWFRGAALHRQPLD
jgi:8-oxo-dGTP diphosphatase